MHMMAHLQHRGVLPRGSFWSWIYHRYQRCVGMPIHVANLRPNNKVPCWLTWASTIKYHRLSSWTSRNLFLIVLEAGSLTPESQYGWILVRALLLACWWLPSCCVVTQTFQGVCTRKGDRDGNSLVSLLIRALILSWGPHPHGLIHL